jgi:radical SAM superfamily enzyme YgiQ (UPF0313 family)
MRYEGPIYRPPSEAGSLLIQATVGCPHNRCTFCMVYKNGPGYKVRAVMDIKTDISKARDHYGDRVQTLFFPAGNTIAMKTDDLCEILSFAKEKLPALQRITVYGSSQYIHTKGLIGLRRLAEAGLTRIHVGLESGDDLILKRIKKGTTRKEQIEAGRWTMDAGIELSLYVILGIGGKERTVPHAIETAGVLNKIGPDFIRLRTFVPKINTPLLADVQNGSFQMLGPHEILHETSMLIEGIQASSRLTSDHYTNYVNLEGRLPEEKQQLLGKIDAALKRDENLFRPFFIGTQ